MPNSQTFQGTISGALKTCALIAVAIVLTSSTLNAFTSQDDAERRRAFQLYKDAKYNEALPLFEKLEKVYPSDPQILETYGLIVFGQNAVLKEPAARKEARKKARELLVRAQAAGANGALTK